MALLFNCAAKLDIVSNRRFHSFLFALDFDDTTEDLRRRFANSLDAVYSDSFGPRTVRDISRRITVTTRDKAFAKIIKETAPGDHLVVAEMGAAHCNGVAAQLRATGRVLICNPSEISNLDSRLGKT